MVVGVSDYVIRYEGRRCGYASARRRDKTDKTMVPYRVTPSAHYPPWGGLDHVLPGQYQAIFRRPRRGRGGGTTHGAG